ncbi:hypothetical protein BDN72DRAFT_863126 [Pluteus cervinus]|uniref:Uncharacterized protein n=1 Tax=Pluteus cervinus TaxID=181527 RepID=A0ACD3A8T2_9AGAR|nr:hypothetical protein BDN72DRAFT_863126 [Pluteus cervinus]
MEKNTAIRHSDQHPILPVELEREIFTLAASTHVRTCCTLALVARRAYIWLQAMLYEVKAFKTNGLKDNKKHTLARLCKALYPAPKRAHLIRSLLLGYSVQPQDLKYTLALCDSVENLALWSANTGPELLPYLERMPLKRLSIGIIQLFGYLPPNFHVSMIFDKVTHLELREPCNSWNRWRSLAQLPELTHLRLNPPYDLNLVQRVLVECPKLQVLELMGDSLVRCHFLAASQPIPSVFDNLHDHRVKKRSTSRWGVLEEWIREAYADSKYWNLDESEMSRIDPE